MARKSNKTAHVLNLLAGQNPGEDTENEKEAVQPEEGTAAAASGESEAAPAAPASVSAQSTQPAPDMPSNISIIDSGTEEDPVAEKIREELLKSLDEEAAQPEPEPQPEEASAHTEAPPVSQAPEPLAEPEEIPVHAKTSPVSQAPEPLAEQGETPAQTELPPIAQAPEPLARPKEAAVLKEETLLKPEPETAPAQKEEPPVEPAPKPEPQPEPEEVLELEETPPPEPEPDYVMLNIMKEIVEDKIIYFMKQFEVCTCKKCKADTIALTLNGLPAKYKIVEKAAAAPLVSFYASRLISQVTVEALKACTQVRDNPRH